MQGTRQATGWSKAVRLFLSAMLAIGLLPTITVASVAAQPEPAYAAGMNVGNPYENGDFYWDWNTQAWRISGVSISVWDIEPNGYGTYDGPFPYPESLNAAYELFQQSAGGGNFPGWGAAKFIFRSVVLDANSRGIVFNNDLPTSGQCAQRGQQLTAYGAVRPARLILVEEQSWWEPDGSVFHGVFAMLVDNGHAAGVWDQATMGDHYVYADWQVKGRLDLKKSSSNPGITSGNPCYDLAGARYGVYSSEADARSGSNPVAEFVTDSAGDADVVELAPGTYYVKETKAPEGYYLDETIYSCTVKPDETAWVNGGTVGDVPYSDPVTAFVHKADPITGGTAQGGASLAGAQFTVKYYAGYYDSDPAVQGVSPTRTWVMQTDEDGYCRFASEYVVGGDEFYLDPLGNPTFPLGTVTVQETKAPEGYHLSTPDYPNKVFVQKITQAGIAGDGADQWNEHEFLDQVKAAECYITKIGTKIGDDVVEGGAAQAIPLEGIEFSLYSSKDYDDNGDGSYTLHDGAQAYAVIMTDENGIASTHYIDRPDGQNGALPYDTYLVVETKPAPDYDPIDPFTFDAHEDGKTYTFLANNTFITAGVAITKADAESGLPVLVPGATFQVLDESGSPIVWEQTYPEPVTFTDLVVGDAGTIMLPDKLNAGEYSLHEIAAPEGYVLGTQDIPFTVDRTTGWDEPLSIVYEDMPQKGTIEVAKLDAETGLAVPDAGIVFEIVAASDITTGDGVVHVAEGDVAAVTETGADGVARSPELYLGSYLVYERQAPEGYVINREPVSVELAYAGQDVSVTSASAEVSNMPQKGVIEIAKADSETGAPVAAEGIGFKVTAASDIVTGDGTVRAHEGDVVAEVETGADGVARTGELYLGSYVVEETAAPEGYVINREPVSVELAYAGQDVSVTTVPATVSDAPQKGLIEIAKADSETGEPVAGAVYRVTAASDIVTGDGTVRAHEGDVVAEVETGADGVARTGELYLGSYVVEETYSPDGYGIDLEKHAVELSYAGQEVSLVEHEEAYEDHPTVFGMEKQAEQIDGSMAAPLETEWQVWAEDADGNTVFELTVVTDDEGRFEIPYIPHGDGYTYYYKEVRCDDDWILDPETYSFTVDADGLINGEPVYTVTNVNYHKRIIEVDKIDSSDGSPVPGTLFELDRWSGGGIPSEMGGDDASGEWVHIASDLTGEDGTILFDGLEFGCYRLTEVAQNPDYMSPEEAGEQRVRYIECSPESDVAQIQVIGNEPLTVSTTVDKSTIEKTSAGLSYIAADGNEISNVGNESYRYDVSFSSTSNVYGDEYWVVDECQMVLPPCDMRIVKMVMPATVGDTDGAVSLLVRTNMTGGEGTAAGMNFAQPELHSATTLCDGTQRFDPTGWDFVGTYPAGQRADVDLGFLEDGEYITGVALCYGAVEVGFATVEPLSYLVEASHELPEWTVIPNTATSHISRNWSSVDRTPDGDIPRDEPAGPHDDAVDDVETAVFKTFGMEWSRDLGSSAAQMASTGDPLGIVFVLVSVIVAMSGIFAFGTYSKQKRERS